MKITTLKSLFSLLFIISLLAGCSKQASPASFSSEDYKGKWLVINYWASWCKPCIEEIPELNSFAIQSSNAAVFAVNFDGLRGETLQQQATKIGIEFTLLSIDPAQQLKYPRPTVLPTTILINPEGKLHKTLLGPQTASSLQQAQQ